jgi:hypothetical protein
MYNIFVIAAIISVVYFIAKFIEMRYIEKENKPLKFLIRDALLVYFSVICGFFISEQVKLMIHTTGVDVPTTTPVFTDNPEF